MNFLNSFLSLAVVSSTNIMVPVTSDRYGHAIVEVDIFGETPSHHSLIVSLISILVVDDDYRTRHWNITLSNTNISLVHTTYSVLSHSREVRLGELGIGQFSNWVRQYQSLAVIKNTTDPTHLVVGSTSEYFASVCVEGSLIRVDGCYNRGVVEFSAVFYNPEGLLPLTDIHIDSYFYESPLYLSTSLAVRVGARLMETGAMPDGPTEGLLPLTDIHIDSFFYESPLYLSTSLAERVGARLMETGAMPDGPNSFRNCTHLPDDLALTLVIASGRPSIRLFPDDYIKHNPLVHTCTFYLTRFSGRYRSSTVVFNPLLVSGLNVRTTDSHFLEICDTSL